MSQPTDHVTALARRFAVDVWYNSAWASLIGIEEFKPLYEQRRVVDEAYEDEGHERQVITGDKWGLEVKLIHRAGLDATFNPVHEYLRTQAEVVATDDAEVLVRWYDRTGRPEAYDGYALVDWTPDGGKGDARDTVSVKLSGQGPRTAITNPAA